MSEQSNDIPWKRIYRSRDAQTPLLIPRRNLIRPQGLPHFVYLHLVHNYAPDTSSFLFRVLTTNMNTVMRLADILLGPKGREA